MDDCTLTDRILQEEGEREKGGVQGKGTREGRREGRGERGGGSGRETLSLLLRGEGPSGHDGRARLL